MLSEQAGSLQVEDDEEEPSDRLLNKDKAVFRPFFQKSEDFVFTADR